MTVTITFDDIEYHCMLWSGRHMKKLFSSFLMIWLSAGMAHAACYADYKAKQDGPLRLHYGVAEVRGDCSVSSAENQLRPALAGDGWQLLNVLGVFDDAGLEERKGSAGEYFLRY
jgi:hypothetical protein